MTKNPPENTDFQKYFRTAVNLKGCPSLSLLTELNFLENESIYQTLQNFPQQTIFFNNSPGW